MGNIVAIVGRPNVGKSTFFNRLIGGRQSIVDDISGVTRDRQYGNCEWNGKTFTVIDTGGFVHGSDDVFEAAIREQVHIAIDEAAVIVFCVNVTTGITDLDEEVAQLLRKTKKPVFLMVNKVDNHERMLEANEFWSLGFEETHFVSSLTGEGRVRRERGERRRNGQCKACVCLLCMSQKEHLAKGHNSDFSHNFWFSRELVSKK